MAFPTKYAIIPVAILHKIKCGLFDFLSMSRTQGMVQEGKEGDSPVAALTHKGVY